MGQAAPSAARDVEPAKEGPPIPARLTSHQSSRVLFDRDVATKLHEARRAGRKLLVRTSGPPFLIGVTVIMVMVITTIATLGTLPGWAINLAISAGGFFLLAAMPPTSGIACVVGCSTCVLVYTFTGFIYVVWHLDLAVHEVGCWGHKALIISIPSGLARTCAFAVADVIALRHLFGWLCPSLSRKPRGDAPQTLTVAAPFDGSGQASAQAQARSYRWQVSLPQLHEAIWVSVCWGSSGFALGCLLELVANVAVHPYWWREGLENVAEGAPFAFLAAFASSHRARDRVLSALHVRSGSVSAAAGIASLLAGVPTRSALSGGRKLLRAIPADKLPDDIFASNSRGHDYFALTVPMDVGAVDYFVSHSWSDDSRAKLAILRNVCAEFQARNGREARLWIDRCCLDQGNVEESLLYLPIFLASSKRLLVIAGPTYLTRLWCIVEIFVYVQMHIDMGAAAGALAASNSSADVSFSAKSTGSASQAPALRERAHTNLEVHVMPAPGFDWHADVDAFDVRACTCTMPQDHRKLISFINAASGDVMEFNGAATNLLSQTPVVQAPVSPGATQSAASRGGVNKASKRASSRRAGAIGERTGSGIAHQLRSYTRHLSTQGVEFVTVCMPPCGGEGAPARLLRKQTARCALLPRSPWQWAVAVSGVLAYCVAASVWTVIASGPALADCAACESELARLGFTEDGWLEQGGTQIAYVQQARDWDGAMAECEARGARLVHVKDEQRNRAIQCLVGKMTPEVWIGLRQREEAPTPQSLWVWPDGQALGAGEGDLVGWGQGQPNWSLTAIRREHGYCAKSVGSHYTKESTHRPERGPMTWSDAPCTGRLAANVHFVCERIITAANMATSTA